MPKRSSSNSNALLFILLLVFSIVAYAAYKFRFAAYFSPKNVNKVTTEFPKSYKIRGIDVSYYQGNIDWKEVSKPAEEAEKNIQFVFIKATEGVLIKDRKFNKNWKGSKEHGITRGAYHFYRPSKDPEKQAKHFIRNVKIQKGDLAPVLDIEVDGGKSATELRAGLKKWIKLVEAHYGIKPIIYSNAQFYHDYLEGHFDNYPIWVAHYHVKKVKMRNKNRKWHFWQLTDRGKFRGINHDVDFNVFHGSESDFKKLCK